jgi:transposase-like protein
MDTHKNASLTPKGREAMVRTAIEGGLTKAAAALQFNVAAKTVAKWVRRSDVRGGPVRQSRIFFHMSGKAFHEMIEEQAYPARSFRILVHDEPHLAGERETLFQDAD